MGDLIMGYRIVRIREGLEGPFPKGWNAFRKGWKAFQKPFRDPFLAHVRKGASECGERVER